MTDYIVAGPEVIKYLKLYADKNVEEQMAEQMMEETQKKEEEYRKLEEYYATKN